MTRYVIVGTGVAGIAAVNTLRTLERSADISLVGDDPHGFYSRPGLAYMLNGEVPDKHLTIYSKDDWKQLKIRYVRGLATQLNSSKHQLEFGTTGVLKYDRLLLATGSTAVLLNIPGANLKGVVKLDDFEDTRHILSLTRHAKSAVVVGGGIIAVELVEGLLARGLRVHYFLRGGRYWPNVLDEKESRLLEHRLTEDGVLLHFHTEAAEILGRHGKVAGVRTTKGETIQCEIVAVGVGVKPRMELAKQAGIKTDKGILTDEYLQTSEVDIFAAGDASQVHDPISGQSIVDTLWHPARGKGKIAALNMTGRRTAYKRKISINVLRLAGVMTTIVGAVGSGMDEDLVSVARGSSETWQQLPNTLQMDSYTDVNHLRLMIGERTLLGAMVMGEQKLSEPLQEIISTQADISPMRSLLKPGAQLGEIVMDFWTSIRN
jgi:NAD(P)H-nitrite reductase large subunit